MDISVHLKGAHEKYTSKNTLPKRKTRVLLIRSHNQKFVNILHIQHKQSSLRLQFTVPSPPPSPFHSRLVRI